MWGFRVSIASRLIPMPHYDRIHRVIIFLATEVIRVLRWVEQQIVVPLQDSNWFSSTSGRDGEPLSRGAVGTVGHEIVTSR
jgi:hypothetical protein